jgi:hypothetical protein
MRGRISKQFGRGGSICCRPPDFFTRLSLYGCAFRFLPGASLFPLSPIGEDPVREVDILALAGAKGNVATPFAWGSYVSWRLYPNIKISMDGRYETLSRNPLSI